jgi:protocatechuate 4,5-dioxygenase alpha chain
VTQSSPKIPGTTPFDGEQARKGYCLNKMCYSFNSAANRAEFLENEEAYMSKYGLNEQHKAAIRSRGVLALIAAGGNAPASSAWTCRTSEPSKPE